MNPQSAKPDTDPQEVVFTASIRVMDDELEEAGGSLARAVQDLIGHTGAQLLELEQG